MPTWASVLIALSSPILGIVGVYFGTRTSAGNDERRWQLDVKRDLYLRIAVSVNEVQEAASSVFLELSTLIPDESQDRVLSAKSRFVAAQRQFFPLVPEAAMLASSEVYDGLREFMSLVVQVLDDGEHGEPIAESVVEANAITGRATERITDAMRVDLGFGEPQLHVGWRK